jgi:hypothetical protein
LILFFIAFLQFFTANSANRILSALGTLFGVIIQSLGTQRVNRARA